VLNDVVKTVGDEFDLSSELLHRRPLRKLDALRTGVAEPFGDCPHGFPLDVRISEGDDVLFGF